MNEPAHTKSNSAEHENAPVTKRKRRTDEERLDDLIKGQQEATQNLSDFRKKIDIKLLKSVRQEFGDNVTAARFKDAIEQLKNKTADASPCQPQSSDPNTERQISIGKYIESITGPNITADQLQSLLERLTRNIKPAADDLNDDGSPKTQWEKKSIAVYISREYAQPGSTS